MKFLAASAVSTRKHLLAYGSIRELRLGRLHLECVASF